MDAALERVLQLEIPPRPEYVSVVRLVVATAAKSRRVLTEERVDDLTLALSEACTNAIEAHEGDRADQHVVVEVAEGDDRIIVTVVDRGPGFDPMAVPLHPPVTSPERLNYERGLGIPIIRTLVDAVTFTSGEGGTRVDMVLECERAPAEPELLLDDLGDLEAAWDDEEQVDAPWR